MEITFTRTTTYTLDVADDDDAMLTALTTIIAPLYSDEAGESLAEMIDYACRWDVQDVLSALVPHCEVSAEPYESESWDVDGIMPDEDVEVEALA